MNKALVVDLDGTLFNANTFHLWLRFLIAQSILSWKLKVLFNIILYAFLRMFNVISHSKLKHDILMLVQDESFVDNLLFVEKISIFSNDLNKYLKDDSFDIKILATAAPYCYASIIAKKFNFDTCLASLCPNQLSENKLWKENIKETKKQNVMNFLKKYNLSKINTFITDHIDDFPLMKCSDSIILIKPDDSVISTLKKHGIMYEIYK